MNITQSLGLACFCLIASTTALSQTTTYYGCVDKNGNLTMVSQSTLCKVGSTRIQWNDPGPQGPKGDKGDVGPKGDKGDVGPPGPGLETGKIRGRVIGCDTAPVSHALVSIRGLTPVVRPTLVGDFELTYIAPGTYDVEIEIDGNALRVATGVAVVGGQATDLGDQDICAVGLCVPGAAKPCPNQLGVCQGSMMVCPQSGIWPSDCNYSSMGLHYSTTELCDGLDNNCNGLVDEDYQLKNTACLGLLGGVCVVGSYVCSPTQTSLMCTAGSVPCGP